jgi:hypothetical protein
VNVNGTLSYLGSDGQASVSIALSATGTQTAAALYTPYGTTRYSSGTMPTSIGFSGRRGDPSGLSYGGGTYYDASAGVNASSSSTLGGNPLANVSQTMGSAPYTAGPATQEINMAAAIAAPSPQTYAAGAAYVGAPQAAANAPSLRGRQREREAEDV